MKSNKNQRNRHKQDSLAGMCNLNPEEILLHAALLRFWQRMGNKANPYITFDGREIISIPDSQSPFEISLDGKEYVHYAILAHANNTLVSSIHIDKLKQRTKTSLNALLQFYKDSAFSTISCGPTSLPVYSTKVNGLQAHLCDYHELKSFLRDNDREREFYKPGNVIYLRVLFNAQKELCNDIAHIDMNQLPDNIRSDLDDLKKLDLGENFDDHHFWSKISIYMDTLYCFLRGSLVLGRGFSPLVMIPALRFLVETMVNNINSYEQNIDRPHSIYLPHAIPLLLSTAATAFIFSKGERLQMAFVYFLSLFICIDNMLLNPMWQVKFLNMLIGMLELHGLRPPTPVFHEMHLTYESLAAFEASIHNENIHALNAMMHMRIHQNLNHQIENDDTDSESSFGSSDFEARMPPA